MQRLRIAFVVALAAGLGSPAAMAQVPTGGDLDPNMQRSRIRTEVQEQERIYGAELMNEQERNEYRERIRAAESDEARAALRAEHRDMIRKRAQAQGVELPDGAPAQRMQKGKPPHAAGGGPGTGPHHGQGAPMRKKPGGGPR